MTTLTIYRAATATPTLGPLTDGDPITRELRARGVRFERWPTHELTLESTQEDILARYAPEVARLKAEGGYQAADVIRLKRGAPNAAEMRAKFLDEHTHAEDEVRFFVEGAGSFYLHLEPEVLQVICTRGDLISVPAGTRHWFDMGPNPEFCAVRLFTNPAGWVANFTQDPIARRFPRFD